MKKYIVPVIAILSILTLEIVAMSLDKNGAAFGVSIATISGICGYWIKSLRR
ncbi:hypothetical protein ES703_58586 [subsurface metagenome]